MASKSIVIVISNNDYTKAIGGTVRFDSSSKTPYMTINGVRFVLTSDRQVSDTIRQSLNQIYRFSQNTEELLIRDTKHSKSVLSLTRAIRHDGTLVEVYDGRQSCYVVIKTERNKETNVTLVSVAKYNKYFGTH